MGSAKECVLFYFWDLARGGGGERGIKNLLNDVETSRDLQVHLDALAKHTDPAVVTSVHAALPTLIKAFQASAGDVSSAQRSFAESREHAVYYFYLTSHSHPSMLFSSLMRAGVILLLPFLFNTRCVETHTPSALC